MARSVAGTAPPCWARTLRRWKRSFRRGLQMPFEGRWLTGLGVSFGKLSPIDLKSYRRWYDYSRARDAMFTMTDTEYSPWYVANADNKNRTRTQRYQPSAQQDSVRGLPRKKVSLPQRQNAEGYRESDHHFRYVPRSSEGALQLAGNKDC